MYLGYTGWKADGHTWNFWTWSCAPASLMTSASSQVLSEYGSPFHLIRNLCDSAVSLLQTRMKNFHILKQRPFHVLLVLTAEIFTIALRLV